MVFGTQTPPTHCMFMQFPMHIINPSTAAGSQEMLTRHPVVKGERAAAGHVGEKGGKDTGIYKA